MRRALLIVTAMVVVAGIVGAGAGPVAATKTAGFCADGEEAAFLTLINAYRAGKGLGPLTLTQTLSAASDHHSKSMAKHNYFDHDLKPEGISWSKNMTNHGYDYNTWRGENIAAGRGTAEGAFDQWRNSPAHNDNMLLGHFNAIGIGRVYVADSRYGWYWTTDFGGHVDRSAERCGEPSDSTSAKLQIVGSGRSSNSNSSSYAYDANSNTAWYSTAPKPDEAYVYFDLGSRQSIRTIKWMFSQSGGADDFRISVSNDNKNWNRIAMRGNAAAGTWHQLSTNSSARYVRFRFLNPHRDAVIGNLAEVQVYS